MRFFQVLALAGAVSAAPKAAKGKRAVTVSGSAEGFAAGVTGGGDATAVYPTTTDELVSYLGDDEPRVIVLNQEFDFTGTTATASGCAPWGTASACQIAINKDDWCTNYQPDAPTVSSITYDEAGMSGIDVASDKTLIGDGTSGVIKGKGLRMANGVSNIIIQNIHVTEINPQYVWGGDGITIDGADMVWIDHVKTSLIGRQHIVLGEESSGRVTISNSELDGNTDWSATCDGLHYWGYYFTGSSDTITLKGNYVHHTSGRGPKVGGNTVLHAVNNYFGPSSHNFEIGSGGYVLAEGNVFDSVDAPVDASSLEGEIFTAEDVSACSSYLGRDCEANSLSSSGDLSGTDSDVLSKFSDASNIASADSPSSVSSNVPSSAGFGI
ncbi:pectin lyase fold/virulence factor [Pseudomassariella vexata]|uniref:pectin lyase n=1 Tax=Pseudomassariella vexata TaxID=1141098 RepID=A0A1Y2E6Q3_9PEZI|nr:pectin lyase fold/virulence factor [Pseudomassariella vexata]ORY67014.1 pectin lyase fold/virulence factor [Pseudomassariella vexata]